MDAISLNNIFSIFDGVNFDGIASLIGELMGCIPSYMLFCIFFVIFVGFLFAVFRCILGLL